MNIEVYSHIELFKTQIKDRTQKKQREIGKEWRDGGRKEGSKGGKKGGRVGGISKQTT